MVHFLQAATKLESFNKNTTFPNTEVDVGVHHPYWLGEKKDFRPCSTWKIGSESQKVKYEP